VCGGGGGEDLPARSVASRFGPTRAAAAVRVVAGGGSHRLYQERELRQRCGGAGGGAADGVEGLRRGPPQRHFCVAPPHLRNQGADRRAFARRGSGARAVAFTAEGGDERGGSAAERVAGSGGGEGSGEDSRGAGAQRAAASRGRAGEQE
jgi:hypothetical protein